MKIDSVCTKNTRANKQHRLDVFDSVDVYPVTCEKLSNNRSDYEVLDCIINSEAKIVQLRDKNSTKRRLYEKAVQFRKATLEAGILLIINDHLDIAVAVKADGVHLGQDDFPPWIAKDLYPELIIGVSTHSLQEARKAESEGADYINIGPIFSTETKGGLQKFLGPEMIPKVSESVSIPYTVMGGINWSNLDAVLAVGAKKIAMITAITMAKDITKAVDDFRNRMNSRVSGCQ